MVLYERCVALGFIPSHSVCFITYLNQVPGYISIQRRGKGRGKVDCMKDRGHKVHRSFAPSEYSSEIRNEWSGERWVLILFKKRVQ